MRYLSNALSNNQILTGVLHGQSDYRDEILGEINERSLAKQIVHSPDFKTHIIRLMTLGLRLDISAQIRVVQSGNINLVEKMLSRLDEIDGKALQKAANKMGLVEMKGFIRGYCAALNKDND